MASPLDVEFQHYLDNRENLLADYAGQTVVIKGKEVIGVHADPATAVFVTQTEHELGTFLVQRVGGTEEHTAVLRSRIIVDD